MLPILLLGLLARGINAQADANGVVLADKILNMERQILTPGKFDFPVSPCSFLLNDNPNRGEQTSAEWVRIIFHDMVTHNATAGTGGLDASIGYETNRAENVGVSFVNATIVAFDLFFNVFSSMSDLIALGLVEALFSCDPDARALPLRVGRIDATGPGPFGVPGPMDSVAVATAAFANAGFSSTEMIQAVACGHSLGGVHNANFPLISPATQISPTNLDGVSTFDTTPAVFDNVGVNQYLNGTTLNPLVVGANVSARSDFRIFNSDHNATISAMASAQAFEDTCFTIFEKMINTVPSNVVLSDPIGPRPYILMESHLGLSSTGVVTYAGIITGHGPATPPTLATYTFVNSAGATIGPFSSSAGTTVPFRLYSKVTSYPFNTTLSSTTINTITVMGSFSYPINLNVFVLQPLSWWDPVGTQGAFTTQQFVVRAAVLSSLTSGNTVHATLFYPITLPNTVSQSIGRLTVTMSAVRKVGSYEIFQAVLSLPFVGLGEGESHVSVKVGTQTSDKMSTTLFGRCTNTASPLSC